MRSRIQLAVVAALALGSASADDQVVVPTARESARALNHHVFQPSQLLAEPFTITTFGTATIFALGDATAPQYDILGNQTGTKSYSIAGYGQQLAFDLRLFHDVSLRLQTNGIIYSGTNARGILVVGGTAQLGASAGLTVGFNIGPTARLAFVADAGFVPQLSVLVGNAVIRAIQDRTFDEGGLFSNANRLRVAPGFSFGWAPDPVIGFVAEGRYLWTRIVSGEDTQGLVAQGLSLGALASLDLDPLIHWPLAFQASYRGDLPVGSRGINELHQAGLGVYYSGRADLALGLEVDWRHGAIRPGVVPTLTSDTAIGSFIFRYYW
jgi:hypothetical protein